MYAFGCSRLDIANYSHVCEKCSSERIKGPAGEEEEEEEEEEGERVSSLLLGDIRRIAVARSVSTSLAFQSEFWRCNLCVSRKASAAERAIFLSLCTLSPLSSLLLSPLLSTLIRLGPGLGRLVQSERKREGERLRAHQFASLPLRLGKVGLFHGLVGEVAICEQSLLRAESQVELS